MTHQSLSLYSLGLAPPGPAMRYAPHQPSAAAQLCAIAPAEPGTLEPGPPPPPKVAHPHSRHEPDARESPPPPPRRGGACAELSWRRSRPREPWPAPVEVPGHGPPTGHVIAPPSHHKQRARDRDNAEQGGSPRAPLAAPPSRPTPPRCRPRSRPRSVTPRAASASGTRLATVSGPAGRRGSNLAPRRRGCPSGGARRAPPTTRG